MDRVLPLDNQHQEVSTHINLKCISVFILVVVTILLIGTGRCGGDEGFIYNFAKEFSKNSYNWTEFIHSIGKEKIYLSHHLAWFILQSSFYFLLDLWSKLFPLLKGEPIRELVMSYLQVTIIFVAIYFSYIYLRKRMNLSRSVSILIVLIFWLSSYGISFLSGSFIENSLSLLVVLRLFIFDDKIPLNKKSLSCLVLIDFLMFAIKSYALIFCFISLLPYILKLKSNAKKKFLLIYGGVFILLGGLWLYFKASISDPSFYFQLITFDVVTFFWRFFQSIFSFSYGLIWGIPVIVLPFIGFTNKKVLFWKYLSVLSILLFLSIFRFWQGEPGIAGGRYIFPFLLLLFPNVAESFVLLVKRYPKIIFVIPCLVIFFFPIINYRHNLVHARYYDLYKTSEASIKMYNGNMMPYFHSGYHPAIFAWKVQFAKWTKQEIDLVLLNDERVSLSAKDILPKTLISRIVFLKEDKNYNDSRHYQPLNLAYQALEKIPDIVITILRIATLLVIILWLVILLQCAYYAYWEVRSSEVVT